MLTERGPAQACVARPRCAGFAVWAAAPRHDRAVFASGSPRPMWPCKQLDLSWRDWRFALGCCLAPSPWEAAAERVERLWPSGQGVLACLNVRSAFDLYLRLRRWPPGDGMACGSYPSTSTPIPAPGGRTISSASSGRRRARLSSRILSGRNSTSASHRDCPCARHRRRRGLCTGLSWSGLDGYPDADLTLFSFGPTKTATALGGAVAHVRDPETLERMRRQRAREPVQPTAAFLRRVLLAGALKCAGKPGVYRALAAALDAAGADREHWTHRLTRNTQPGTAGLRQRPCAALLGLLERRLSEGDAPVTRRTVPGRALFDVPGPGVCLPTRDAEQHACWMAPVLVPDPEACKRALRRAGSMPCRGAFARSRAKASQCRPPNASRERSICRSTPTCRRRNHCASQSA